MDKKSISFNAVSKKKPYFEDKQHADFIRHQPCCMCQSFDGIDERGDGFVTVAHIKARGMGGANHGTEYEYGNLIPLCFKCHRDFDDNWPQKDKNKLLRVGKILTDYYLENVRG